ncbi:hypothetical protein [Rhodococcoides fascians]|uniref:hypothetical protein n=1 Tax=Rhodococcoides fascians TaxID=1828 RepID=UPI00050C3D61|nr:hypothetical protein [Rhodococcus fascians]
MARAFVTVDDQSNLPDPVRTRLKGELDGRYPPTQAVNFTDRGDVIPTLFSYFGNKPNVYSPPTQFDSNHAMSFSGNSSPVVAGGTLLGVGSGPRAMYARTPNMGERLTRIGGRFRLLPGTGTRTTGGTVCLGIADDLIDSSAGVNVSMPCHFLTTARTWYYTVWTEGVGQVVLATGDYATPLLTDYAAEYEMQCWLNGTTAVFDLPDGTRRSVVDSRIGSYGANFGFFEGFQPGGDTDDVTAFTHIWAGLGVARIPKRTLDAPQAGSSFAVAGPTAPTTPGEYAWIETDGNGNFIDLHTGKN